ncbi:MAG: hypothetical protein KA173_14055 [Rhodoferax sp.]|nr:hypothetical protein [Rhodoferax sp.]MBP7493676.1 hypothetical protein [Rhodoferax sp.]
MNKLTITLPEILHPAGGESVAGMIDLKIPRPPGVISVVAGIQYPAGAEAPLGVSLQLTWPHSRGLIRLKSSP